MSWYGQCAMKCEQCKKDGHVYVERVEKVSEVLNTSLNVRILGMIVYKTTMRFLGFARRCSSFVLIDLTADFTG